MMINLGLFNDDTGIRHAFFTRRGGVSGGLYASLNCGFGSGDAAESVARNRGIAMEQLGPPAERLATCRQVHRTTVVTLDRPCAPGAAPQAETMATRGPYTTRGEPRSDCSPI